MRRNSAERSVRRHLEGAVVAFERVPAIVSADGAVPACMCAAISLVSPKFVFSRSAPRRDAITGAESAAPRSAAWRPRSSCARDRDVGGERVAELRLRRKRGTIARRTSRPARGFDVRRGVER